MAISRWAAAFSTLRDGLSARAGLARARAQGVKVRDSTWYGLVGTARAHYGNILAEVDRPLDRRPQANEVTLLPADKAKGYIHYVELIVRNKTGGKPYVRPQAVHSSRLMTREAAIDVAKERYQRAVDRSRVAAAQWGTDPDEVVEAGVYRTTQKFQPGMLGKQ